MAYGTFGTVYVRPTIVVERYFVNTWLCPMESVLRLCLY